MKAVICAPVTETSLDAAVQVSNSAETDLVELRLDFLRDYGGLAAIRRIKKPIIATCMPKWEGGRFAGTEKERIAVLKEACRYAKYVSVELKTDKILRGSLIKEARKNKVKVIISHHDYNKTPADKEIKKTIRKEKEAGADVAKISYAANEYGDALRVMRALSENKTGIPVIAISMGEKGRITRVLGPLFGSYLTFAAIAKGKESAPGQMTVKELRDIFRNIK
jgi:3-dehydroquinate dehydratase type I